MDPTDLSPDFLDAEYHFRQKERQVVGYHATSNSGMESIIASQDFFISQNDWEWLGYGVYFWEGPARAWEWALERFKQDGRVVFASVRLGRCIDLTDAPAWSDVFNAVFNRIKAELENTGQPMPKNKGKARYLDCLVFNVTAHILGADTVRAVAIEGEPLFQGTEHRTQQHIQLCVKNKDCIEKPVLVLGDFHEREERQH